jgi:hypothetical protein
VELTARELAGLTALASGLTSEAAARVMGTSDRTLRRAQREAADRVGVPTPVQALVIAAAAGLIDVGRARAGELPEWPDELYLPQAGGRPPVGMCDRFMRLRDEGVPVQAAADEVGVLVTTAWGWDQRWREARCGGGGG